MSKAKKTGLLLDQVINKNICISKRFKCKVEASSILSEYEAKATNDLRKMINQSRIRAERMRIGNDLNDIIDNSNGQFNRISSNILSHCLYKNNEDFSSQAEILRRVTERENITEAKAKMDEIYKELCPKLQYKTTKHNENVHKPKQFSIKALLSNKNYFLKEIENDERILTKRIQKYLETANAVDGVTVKFIPNVKIDNDIKLLHYNPKDNLPFKEVKRDIELFNLIELKKYTKRGMRERKSNSNSKEDNIKSQNEEKVDRDKDNDSSDNGNRKGNSVIKRYYENTISLVKNEAYENLFYKKKMMQKSQSVDHIIKCQLPKINSHESKDTLHNNDAIYTLVNQKALSNNNNPKVNEKDMSNDNQHDVIIDKSKFKLLSSRDALKPKFQLDLSLLNLINGEQSKRVNSTPKRFKTKQRRISKFSDRYSNATGMNDYLKEACEFLGNKLYTKKQMNNQLDQFYSKIKPISSVNILKEKLKKKKSIDSININTININNNFNIITTLATKKTELNGPISTNNLTNQNY